jgi:hypothetical protein
MRKRGFTEPVSGMGGSTCSENARIRMDRFKQGAVTQQRKNAGDGRTATKDGVQAEKRRAIGHGV